MASPALTAILGGLTLAAGSAPPAVQASPAKPAPQQTKTSSGLSGHDTNAPIDISADHGTLESQNKRAFVTGNVKAVQTDMTITSDRMTLTYTDDSNAKTIQRIDAAGNVVVRSPTETSHSPFAIYDLNKKLVTMLGGVVLDKQGGDEIRSQRLVYDLNTGRANVDSGGVNGGRVTGHFNVPQKDDSSSTTPAKTGAASSSVKPKS